MTFCPKNLLALSARLRMTMSVEPPAGQGQMYLIGRAGKFWARDRVGKAAETAKAELARRKLRRCVMRIPSRGKQWQKVNCNGLKSHQG
jgi:hypothetical protein